MALHLLQRVLVRIQNALLDQLLRVGAALQPLLQTIRSHVVFELALLLLQCRRRIGRGEDVALDEVSSVGARVEALFEVVCCALALQLEGLGLQGAVREGVS